MDENRNRLGGLIDTLTQQRDKLAVQVHLGKVEAKDEWARLTAKLDQLKKDYEPLKDAVGDSAGNVFDALKLVAGEVRDGFDRIRKSL